MIQMLLVEVEQHPDTRRPFHLLQLMGRKLADNPCIGAYLVQNFKERQAHIAR